MRGIVQLEHRRRILRRDKELAAHLEQRSALFTPAGDEPVRLLHREARQLDLLELRGVRGAADGTWQPVPSEAFGPLTDDGNYFVTPTATIHFVVEENGAKKWVVRTLPQTDEIVRADYAEDTGEMRLAFIDRHEVWKLRDKVDGVFVWEWYKVSDVPATYYLAPTVPQGIVPVYHGIPSELVPAYAVLSFGAKELVSSRGVQKLEPFESQVDWQGYSFLTDQRHPRDTGMAAPKNLIMGLSSRYVAGATEAYILEPAQ